MERPLDYEPKRNEPPPEPTEWRAGLVAAGVFLLFIGFVWMCVRIAHVK